ncbi:uncharacterized protein LOC141649487 [Silene latifolia]|uniref:uncharacterized protein LOC141649487 n=1 Tax=Silene latifolia TaxID=37657 RepID=UPI003D7808E4
MANQDWLNQFPDMVAHFYPAGLFDHSPCVVHNSMLQTTRRASFKFFNMWTQAPSFIKIVQEGWEEVFYGQKMFIVVKKLKHLKSKLKELNKECYFDIENNACIAEKELNAIQLQLETDPQNESFIREEIKLAKFELRDLNLARESFLKRILKLDGWNMGIVILPIFMHPKSKLKELNKECYFDIENNACIAEKELNAIQLQLETDPQNESFIREEIKLAAELRDLNLARESFLKQKAKTQWLEHGDSNTAYFHGAIKKKCSINKITQTEDQNGTLCKDNQSIQGALPATLLNQLNATNITLIPKCDRSTSVKHFRHIARCNIIYKVISKLLCNRLALDIVKLYNRNAASPRCLFKIDLQKAYDTVEWDFVEQLLMALGFFDSFTQKVYYNGVSPELKLDFQQATGFVEGSMPFRYLGVPIQLGRLTKKECNILAEKMVNIIRSLGAKKLSYAGRLVLINSVLNTLYSYWASIFLIPKGVIRRVEAICRNYLWGSSADYHRTPLIAWDKFSQKKRVAWGLKKLRYGILPLLQNWWIGFMAKIDRLWIRWINQIYIKNKDWHHYTPPQDASLVWKCVCRVKEIMKSAYDGNQ